VILEAIAEAIGAGARLAAACRLIGISARTVERWRARPGGEDQRRGPRHAPRNALTAPEQAKVVAVMTSPRYAGMSPKQVVPRLADEGQYLASESTMYRLQRQLGLRAHRRSTPRTHVTRAKSVHQATGPNQVWSWDITWLPTTVRGQYLFLYLIMDVWSRRIVGWQVHAREGADEAAALICLTCDENGVDPKGLVLHSDNGKPMRGSTMLATLQWLGVVPSFSRPHVSDDNPYSEALFRTLKYAPAYPRLPFADAAAARAWVQRFVAWYNGEHRHSGIRFVTPDERHFSLEKDILVRRHALYQQARRRRPERWSRTTRNWNPVAVVVLNPEPAQREPALLEAA
jgi:transposase InsO family protein